METCITIWNELCCWSILIWIVILRLFLTDITLRLLIIAPLKVFCRNIMGFIACIYLRRSRSIDETSTTTRLPELTKSILNRLFHYWPTALWWAHVLAVKIRRILMHRGGGSGWFLLRWALTITKNLAIDRLSTLFVEDIALMTSWILDHIILLLGLDLLAERTMSSHTHIYAHDSLTTHLFTVQVLIFADLTFVCWLKIIIVVIIRPEHIFVEEIEEAVSLQVFLLGVAICNFAESWCCHT